jgi:hypothetical protein
MLVERAAHAAAILFEKEWRLLLCVWISRVPEAVAEVVVHRAVKLVGPWLGEDFDAAIAQLVELW